MNNQVIKRINNPAPRWFRKTKKAVTLLSDTAIVMLLASGFASDSLIMLWLRVGISGLLQTLEAILVEDQDESMPTAAVVEPKP